MNKEHIFTIGISVDDDAIIQAAIKAATDELSKVITDCYVENNYYTYSCKPKQALEDIISEKVDALIDKHGDMIYEAIVDKVADKIFRSKKVKEYIASVTSEEVNE